VSQNRNAGPLLATAKTGTRTNSLNTSIARRPVWRSRSLVEASQKEERLGNLEWAVDGEFCREKSLRIDAALVELEAGDE